MAEITSENIFEVLGVYFANAYWNTLYHMAVDEWREERFNKQDDAYKTIIERYSRAFCTPDSKDERISKQYLQILMDLHKKYKEFLQTSDTLLGFIDVVSKFFLPKEYYRTLASRDPKKDIIFRKILTKTVMKFTIYISQEEVKNVIDIKLRQEKKYVINLKKKFIDILTQERNEFCTLLLAKNSGIDIKNRDEIPQIPKEVCDKLQLQIKKLITEKADLIHKLNGYAKYIGILKKIIRKNESMIEKLGGNQTGSSESGTEEEEKPRNGKRAVRARDRTARTVSRVRKPNNPPSHVTSKPETAAQSHTTPSHATPSHAAPEPDHALEELKNEEYSGDEFETNDRVRNVEEVELPENEFQPDE